MGVTRKDAETAFNRLADALGKDTHDTVLTDERTPTGGIVYQGNVGAWRLDWHYNGRCKIEEITNKHWGVRLPFGERLHTPTEFVNCVNFMLFGLEVVRGDLKAHLAGQQTLIDELESYNDERAGAASIQPDAPHNGARASSE